MKAVALAFELAVFLRSKGMGGLKLMQSSIMVCGRCQSPGLLAQILLSLNSAKGAQVTA
jgi:hypothetical protein